MNLGGFIDTFKDAIAKRVVESYPPLYRPSENGGTLPRLLRKPLEAQADAIRGAALSLKAHLVRIEPILRAYLGSQATSGRLPHLPSVSAYYPVTTHQRPCVPTRHTTGIERPWCVDRLPSHISKMVVSTVCVGGPERTELSLSQKWCRG